MAVVTVIWCVGLKCLFGSSIFICHGCLQLPATYYTHYHFGVCGCHSAFSSPSIKKIQFVTAHGLQYQATYPKSCTTNSINKLCRIPVRRKRYSSSLEKIPIFCLSQSSRGVHDPITYRGQDAIVCTRWEYCVCGIIERYIEGPAYNTP
jgi:hypothetical protein